jgi:hypothetical protein
MPSKFNISTGGDPTINHHQRPISFGSSVFGTFLNGSNGWKRMTLEGLKSSQVGEVMFRGSPFGSVGVLFGSVGVILLIKNTVGVLFEQ